MSKSKKFAEVGMWTLGIGNASLNAIVQAQEMKLNPELKFDWKKMIIAFMKGAIVGAAGGAAIGATVDYRNPKVGAVMTDGYLRRLSDRVRLDKQSSRFKAVDEKAETLATILQKRFKSKLVTDPERLGSTEKGTALQNKFDIDLGLKFWHYSFQSTAKMRFAVLKFLRSKLGMFGIVEVREQRTSIGVMFKSGETTFKIDVVPVKITEGNKDSGYLSVIKSSFLFEEYSHQKTNIRLLNKVKLSTTQKQIVLLLKHWKDKNDIPLGSHLLENLVLDAYETSSYIPKGFTEKVIMVLRHIAENLDVAVIRGIENSNNIITNIDASKKEQIMTACSDIVGEYQHHPNAIKQLF